MRTRLGSLLAGKFWLTVIGFMLFSIYPVLLIAGGDDAPTNSVDPRSCDTIECLKNSLKEAAKKGVVSPVAVVNDRSTARPVNSKLDSLLEHAYAFVRDRVLTDAAAEQYFANIAARIDDGMAVDEKTTRHTVNDDGSEELLVIGGTASDVRLLIGRRDAYSSEYTIAAHLAWDGTDRRVVRMSLGAGAQPQLVLESQQRVPTPADEGADAKFTPQVVPTVVCFAVSDGDKVRVVCICYRISSQGFVGEICFDSGWM